MSLDIKGRDGALYVGRRRLATLTTWWKQGLRVTFTIGDVNRFAAGLGPPTAIELPLTPKIRATYTVLSGSLEDGAVKVDLMQARMEKA